MAFQCLVSERGRGLWVRHRLPQPWLFELAPEALLLSPNPACLLKQQGDPLLGFHSPTGYDRRLPPCHFGSSVHGAAMHGPSPGVSFPTANTSSKEPFTPRIPLLGTLRLQSFDSPDALLPFEPSSHFWPGRSWDSPFREFLLSAIRGHFRSPEPSCRCPIQQVHASNETCWTQPSSRFMRPREGLGKPASGPCSRRESVPVRALFRVAPGSIPSWFSSSLGHSPS